MSKQDPLGYYVPLPLRSSWYAAGFPLQLATNSPHIEETAREIWENSQANPGAEPVTLRIHVTPSTHGPLPAPAMPRGQGHLVSIVFGPQHYALCDVSRGYAFVSLTEDAAMNHEWTRYHFIEPLGWLLVDAIHTVSVHASGVSLNGCAAILCGDTGSGKTTLAYACARRGWTFLSGDAVHLVRGSCGFEIRGRPSQIRFRASAREMFPELAAYPADVRPSGKLDIETSPAMLGIRAACHAEASRFVFLNRSVEPIAPRLDPFTRSAALTQLTDLVCFGDPAIQSAQRETIDRFLSLPLHELTYSDPVSAEAALRDLMESGR